MDFEELIETLSKGSATAVTTLESNVADLNALKDPHRHIRLRILTAYPRRISL